LDVKAESLYLSVPSPYEIHPEKKHKISALKTKDVKKLVGRF